MNYKVNREETVSDLIDGEVILLHLKAGTYYNLEHTSATLWQWLEAEASFESLRSALFEAHPEQPADALERDLLGWLNQLCEEALLVPADRVADGRGPAFAGPYHCPQLFAHADMEELFKLDPVHEAGDLGWPALPAS